MTQLFNRDGSVFNGACLSDDKGRPVRLVSVACDRCHVYNGQRLWVMGLMNGKPYSATGFDCWTCGNTGVRGERKERLFTEAELARINKSAATRAARKAEAEAAAAQKAAIEHAAKEVAFRAENADFLQKLDGLDGQFWDSFRQSFLQRAMAPTARQIELVDGEVAKRAANASSAFIGAVGEKVILTITVERIIELKSEYYGSNYITIARTPDGNVVTYKGKTNLGCVGKTTTVKAAVKEHVLYNGVKQTVIQRPKIVSLC